MQRLKELRLSRKMTQAEVAEKLGVSYQAYAHYEKGRRQPDPEQLKILADLFDVTADELLGREPNRKIKFGAGYRKIEVTPDEEEILSAFRKVKQKFGDALNKSILIYFNSLIGR